MSWSVIIIFVPAVIIVTVLLLLLLRLLWSLCQQCGRTIWRTRITSLLIRCSPVPARDKLVIDEQHWRNLDVAFDYVGEAQAQGDAHMSTPSGVSTDRMVRFNSSLEATSPPPPPTSSSSWSWWHILANFRPKCFGSIVLRAGWRTRVDPLGGEDGLEVGDTDTGRTWTRDECQCPREHPSRPPRNLNTMPPPKWIGRHRHDPREDVEANHHDNREVFQFTQPGLSIESTRRCSKCLAEYHLTLRNSNIAPGKHSPAYKYHVQLYDTPHVLVSILRTRRNLALNWQTRLLLKELSGLRHENVAQFVGVVNANCCERQEADEEDDDDDDKVAAYDGTRLVIETEEGGECGEDSGHRPLGTMKTKEKRMLAANGLGRPWWYWTVWRRYSRRSLAEVLRPNTPIKLNWMIKMSLIGDIVQGLTYLHSHKVIRCHGWMNSRNCLIDSRWQLKLSDFGLSELLVCVHSSCGDIPRRQLDEDKDQAQGSLLAAQRAQLELLWVAPEHLRQAAPTSGSPAGDIYSLGMIIYELLTLSTHPYAGYDGRYELETILQLLRQGPQGDGQSFRPEAHIDHLRVVEAPREVEDIVPLMKTCWHESPGHRPSLDHIKQTIDAIGGKREEDVIQRMMSKLEMYTQTMEDLVLQRTKELEVEKNRSEALLYKIFPRPVADSLKTGSFVAPEKYEHVTIFFSDIVGFTTIASYSEPIQVINLLNVLFTHFDNILKSHDVFKVETIGDGYMVVSGLPTRNTDHAEQIASVALEMLQLCQHFTIDHMPSIPLQIRIGMHTGSVVSGVVGTSNPRYCLFGDTVNFAARMESTALPNTIHVSHTTERNLSGSGQFVLRYRGEIILKGRGKFPTFWLIGRRADGDEACALLLPVPSESGHSHGLSGEDEAAFELAGLRQQTV